MPSSPPSPTPMAYTIDQCVDFSASLPASCAVSWIVHCATSYAISALSAVLPATRATVRSSVPSAELSATRSTVPPATQKAAPSAARTAAPSTCYAINDSVAAAPWTVSSVVLQRAWYRGELRVEHPVQKVRSTPALPLMQHCSPPTAQGPSAQGLSAHRLRSTHTLFPPASV